MSITVEIGNDYHIRQALAAGNRTPDQDGLDFIEKYQKELNNRIKKKHKEKDNERVDTQSA